MQEKVLDDFSGVQNLRKNEIWWFSVSCSSLVASDSIESKTQKNLEKILFLLKKKFTFPFNKVHFSLKFNFYNIASLRLDTIKKNSQ